MSKPQRSGRSIACRVLHVAAVVALAACRDAVAPVAPVAKADLAASPRVPIEAGFVDVPARFEAAPCARVFIAVAAGDVKAAGADLHEGDVLVLARSDGFAMTGAALVLVARVPLATCVGESEKTVLRAGAAPELTWANGQMHAHLDVGREVSPEAYVGRLSGTASVAEHTHPGAWEVLAAVEAAGTFTIDGVDHRLGPRQVIAIPPDTRHAWKADPGSRLVAIQLYDPPGPEQRFLGLAAAAKASLSTADAGAAR